MNRKGVTRIETVVVVVMTLLLIAGLWAMSHAMRLVALRENQAIFKNFTEPDSQDSGPTKEPVMYRDRIHSGRNDVQDVLDRYSPPERVVILQEALEEALTDAADYEKERLEVAHPVLK